MLLLISILVLSYASYGQRKLKGIVGGQYVRLVELA